MSNGSCWLLIQHLKKKKKNFTGHIKQTDHENEKEELPASKMHASDTRAKIPLYIFRTIWG